MKRVTIALLMGLSMAACNSSKVETPPSTTGVHIPSASEISSGKEQYYAQQLPVLLAKNPEADAQAALASGERYLLCGAGRSQQLPGINVPIAALQRKCAIQCLDGVSDALYGQNHQRYLQAALAYSARWNQVMLPACQ